MSGCYVKQGAQIAGLVSNIEARGLLVRIKKDKVTRKIKNLPCFPSLDTSIKVFILYTYFQREPGAARIQTNNTTDSRCR